MKSTLSFLCLLTFLAACGDQGPPTPGQGAEGPWDSAARRAWAANLRDQGLDDQAVGVYEDLLRNDRTLSRETVIGCSVVVADIHMKKGRWAEALASLLRAGQLKPEGELARSIDTKKITCLERLGRTAAADRLLDKAAAGRDGDKAPAVGAVVAKVGAEEIHLSELEGLIAQQPAELRQRFESPEGRLELLKTLVAQRVLERRARRLGLDRDDKVRLAVALANREILVRKLVADEVRETLKLGEADARLYYDAHPGRFRSPGVLEVAHILVDDLEQEKAVRAALQKEDWDVVCRRFSRDPETREQGGRIDIPVTEGQAHGQIPDVAGLFASVGGTPAGSVAPKALKSSRGRHVIKVLKRQDGKVAPFDEVKDLALQLLRREREQDAVRSMMEEALKEADVTLFEDKLNP